MTDTKKEIIDAAMKEDMITKTIDTLEKLPVDWLAHVTMLHGFIHGDEVAIAASIVATEWLASNKPHGVDVLPETAGCLIANVLLHNNFTIEKLASLTKEEWEKFIRVSLMEQDVVDSQAKQKILDARYKIQRQDPSYMTVDPKAQVH